MKKKIINTINSQSNIDPNVYVRNITQIVVVAFFCLISVFLFSLAFLWHSIPGLPLPCSIQTIVIESLKWGIHLIFKFAFKADVHHFKIFLENLKSTGHFHELWIRIGLASIVSLYATYIATKIVSVPVSNILYQEGRIFYEGKEAIKSLSDAMKPWIQRIGADINIHPLIGLTREQIGKHGVIFGAPGAGKTQIILYKIRQIFMANDKLLLHDIKGDFIARFPEATIIAPWDARGVPWAISRDLSNKTAAREFSQCITETKEPMWSSAAREIFIGLIVDLQQRKGFDWGWEDLARQLTIEDESTLQEILRQCNPIALTFITNASNTAVGILITMKAELGWIIELANAWGNETNGGFSITEWINNPYYHHRQIILGNNERFSLMVKGYTASLFAIMSGLINSPEFPDSKTRRLWIYLDEIIQLGKIKFEAFIEIGRSKGVRFWMGFQSLDQIQNTYSENTKNSILSQINNKFICQVAPGKTADELHSLLGTQTIERRNTSITGSGPSQSLTTSQNRDKIDVVHVSYLSSGLGNKIKEGGVKAIYMSNDLNGIYELFWRYDNSPKLQPETLPALWTINRKKAVALSNQTKLAIDNAKQTAKNLEKQANSNLPPEEEIQSSKNKAIDETKNYFQNRIKAFSDKSIQQTDMDLIRNQANSEILEKTSNAKTMEREEDFSLEMLDHQHQAEIIGESFGSEAEHCVTTAMMAVKIIDDLTQEKTTKDPILIRESIRTFTKQ